MNVGAEESSVQDSTCWIDQSKCICNGTVPEASLDGPNISGPNQSCNPKRTAVLETVGAEPMHFQYEKQVLESKREHLQLHLWSDKFPLLTNAGY